MIGCMAWAASRSARARPSHLIVKAPPEPPEVVNGRKGGFIAWTYADPDTAVPGRVKVNVLELETVSGIFGLPSGCNPPRFTTAVPWVLNRLITVSVEKPVPFTVIINPL